MPLFRPSSSDQPGDQSARTPSGKEIPMAMSMMVDSMVRMIQKANNNQPTIESDESTANLDEN
ncbi:MAG: hypothetical protein AB8A49_07385 [Prochlorococcus sp.]|jgi:hypothetical protein|nr:hypothetical protein [Prochlorococcaceae cyanobacterium ETNP2_MAG_10]MDP6197280.1 hypothetical protein [Prochlorococcaceae cyanobacterium ETNP18_MAG_17]HJO77809.1 hypothetical protein [Prochlorococcaceae cyanobacterium Fu_MAG_134]|tara:strand:- start:1271 stop:1459 length:189 start_codon:yes stop_codon:yes gene_type:complete